MRRPLFALVLVSFALHHIDHRVLWRLDVEGCSVRLGQLCLTHLIA